MILRIGRLLEEIRITILTWEKNNFLPETQIKMFNVISSGRILDGEITRLIVDDDAPREVSCISHLPCLCSAVYCDYIRAQRLRDMEEWGSFK